MRIDEDSFGCGEAVTCGRGLVAETPDPEEEHADADDTAEWTFWAGDLSAAAVRIAGRALLHGLLEIPFDGAMLDPHDPYRGEIVLSAIREVLRRQGIAKQTKRTLTDQLVVTLGGGMAADVNYNMMHWDHVGEFSRCEQRLMLQLLEEQPPLDGMSPDELVDHASHLLVDAAFPLVAGNEAAVQAIARELERSRALSYRNVLRLLGTVPIMSSPDVFVSLSPSVSQNRELN